MHFALRLAVVALLVADLETALADTQTVPTPFGVGQLQSVLPLLRPERLLRV
jgi:hypothetical protein